MKKGQINDPQVEDLRSSFFHKRDNVWTQKGKDHHGDDDDFGLFNRRSNWGWDPDEHFRLSADDITWTGWAAYVGFVTPGTLAYYPSQYYIAHNAAARAFRYITVTPAAAQKDIAARVAISYQAEIGIMIDDGVDTGDGEGADNFLRFFIYAAGTLATAMYYRYEYRLGGAAKVVTSFAVLPLHPSVYYGVWISTRGTEWTNWRPRVMVFNEANEASIQAFASVTPAGMAWTPARVGIYYRNIGGSAANESAVDWFHHTF